MFWLGMMLTMILAQSVQWWSEWGFRITVVSSLGANLVVGILSGTRRRSAARWLWALLGEVAKLFVWLAYQVAEAAATSALGSLSLCGSDASEEEKQVVAFWAPFLLLHLGGPDNLTAYALEDNKISNRKWLEIGVRILVVIYTINNNTHRGGRSWALLLAASVVMLVAGVVRYVERAYALRKANLDSMQEDASSSSRKDDFKMLKCRIKRAKRQGQLFRDGEALLLAQDLFPIWRHALVGSSVDPASISPRQEASEMILSEWDWESMCMVAEMELSLIYEFLYTKAILAHTWHYYLIRLLSPLFTAAAAFLFCFWLHPDKQQQGDDGHRVRGSFVGITYALLAITFLMDVAWLLRALGSTWAYAYFQGAGRRWWCSIHRIVVRLDPLQLFCRDPVSHRRWSGTIGRYNLLDECTATPTTRPEWWPVSMPGDDRPKELRYLSKLPQCVKKVLFERVTEILQQAINTEEKQIGQEKEKEKEKEKEEEEKKMYTRFDIRTHWGHKAFRRAPEEVKNKFKTHWGHKAFRRAPEEVKNKFKPFRMEFEEDVLLWHIATYMVLPGIQNGQKGRRRILAWAIEVMSEYMMFLVAVRRQMLPGLVLHSQLQVTKQQKTRDILVQIWNRGDKPTTVESGAAPRVPDEMLEFIFNVWVDKLVYTAVRCSTEAHAKQLSAGGDLTTVLWMLIQHAGPFCIGEEEEEE
ncbi:unnamed protein product [Miscanthus lutarioriparius]|uniref:DUF4220 domain-containing protein n=1 Tax=Miscanthus lutarioriparius TaxID=422564 RepID=A0A811RC69_9POAL|nr:unnamed protein product [Miscanthus lutarioriparius]